MPVHATSVNNITANENTGNVDIQTYKKMFTITNAQIKALPSTPVVLIPSPGANKYISIDSVHLISNITVAYKDSVGGDFVPFDYLSIDTTFPYSPILCVNADTGSFTAFSNLMTDSRFYVLPAIDGWGNSADWGSVIAKGSSASPDVIIDKGIQVAITLDSNLTADLTGGDPANYIKIVIGYSIVDLS